ncbi:MerR family transcriptional regulator [Halalkalibacterium halodurans]|uniref:HTH merR-type domain-containing protein n=1 Tax=Halalkalibacterium halodurans TaxID=86665 RepID=A0A0M0KGQ0_ALKHA|nr:MerR family transcriptional regulator [Halalkalibacterium halodurans]MED4163054.1 MerR family transcriptional regulator [Halalkalibacterium halodurans]TPE68624.1 MerR family transcriptional regulator [Halalkalibacterium halodurans]
MSEKTYTVGEFAKLTGVTERTLRYYDQKGLLKPQRDKQSDHRYYQMKDLIPLQRILTLKSLDFSLSEIKKMMKEEYSIHETFQKQQQLLQCKRDHLNHLIKCLERMLKLSKIEESIDETFYLAFIHSLLYEQDQKQLFREYFSEEIIKKMFLEEMDETKRFEFEQQFYQLCTVLKTMFHQKLPPEHEKVVETGHQLIEMIQRSLGMNIFHEMMKNQDVLDEEALSASVFMPFTDEELEYIGTVLAKVMEGEEEH